jgi:hypothetical protein
LLIVTLYVGDLILNRSNTKIIEEFKKDIVNKYEMSDIGQGCYITFLVLRCVGTFFGLIVSDW